MTECMGPSAPATQITSLENFTLCSGKSGIQFRRRGPHMSQGQQRWLPDERCELLRREQCVVVVLLLLRLGWGLRTRIITMRYLSLESIRVGLGRPVSAGRGHKGIGLKRYACLRRPLRFLFYPGLISQWNGDHIAWRREA